MSRWSRLPEEMRLQVLETLAQDPSHSVIDSGGKYGLANYALVCRSWQSIFEKANFRRLVLWQGDLDDLAKIPKRCRPYVRHVCLRIEIQEYRPWGNAPEMSIRPERMEDIAANNDIIELAVGNLFGVLKSWEKEIKPGYRGMTLEMSIHSPSDPRHVYRGITATRLEMGLPWMDEVGLEGAVARVFGGSVHIRFYQSLPQLNLVTRFIMKRHTRRRVSSFTLHQILSRLPHLEGLVYEPWQQSMDTVQDLVDAGYVNLIKGSLPKGLKHVTLLEDRHVGNTGLSAPLDLAQNAPARTANPFVGAALAKRSLDFESLSASFLVEANDFFRAYKREWTWTTLRSLTLTSQYLDVKRNHYEINGMLKAAGDAALAMPMLRNLEIWNGGPGHAAIFEYHGEQGDVYIGWYSTWDLVIESDVIEAWKSVGYKNHGCQIELHLAGKLSVSRAGDEFRHYRDALDLLRTRKNVISRQSMDELRLEAQNGCMCYP
ncbi:hypothetical protein V8C42DRAFT_324607 [Trichoderma barbatum]